MSFLVRTVLPWLALLPLGCEAAGGGHSAAKNGDSQWVFELLPKPLQKNPRLELTVMTEMTDAGKKLPPASPSHPAYFQAYSGGYHVMGDDNGDTHLVKDADIETILLRSLATSGYLPAKAPEHAPTLLIVYTWGAHNKLKEIDEQNPALAAAAIEKNMLDRASLVGGPEFAQELRQAFEDRSTALQTGGLVDPMFDPIERFKQHKHNNEFLFEQTRGDVYYVVASAYDFQSAAGSHRTLLWRTRMTVSAAGVAQDQTLPTLVLSAGPYFGKEMKDVEIMSKRTVPDGQVEVGTPTVVEAATENTGQSATPAGTSH